jgi:two-component system alkaline phosphatase synthesis response regulator PhoP
MGAKILIADDDSFLLRLVGYLFGKEGYETVSAMDGEEALRKIETEKPDLVILDVMMPGIDGLEVCRQLRSHPETAALPIVMLSARSKVSDRIAGLQAGANEYLGKPSDARQVVGCVAALLERTRRMRCLTGAADSLASPTFTMLW